MVPPRTSGTLFERDAELQALRAAFARARQGSGSLWFVCAEGGGGKTRLLKEFVASISGAGVLWGAAEPVAPPEPYLAFTRALPGFVPAESHSASAARALEAMVAAAADRTVVCVVDDLHYADEGTVGLLIRFASEVARRPWLVIAAFRPGEGVPSLTSGMVELIAQGTASRLDLAPLSPAAIAAFVGEVRGAPADEADVASITFDSGGNPWFVEALARGSGAMSAARDRIQIRLGRLERELPGSFRILSSIAAVTRPIDFEIVANLCGGDSPELRALLRELRVARVLEEGEGGWAFRQELMRRAVLESMIAADRRDAHRTLAEALEGVGNAAELAMHYAAASDARAVPWALSAARAAAAIDAHPEAFGQLRRALSFDFPPEARQEVLSFAAYEALVLFEPAEACRLANEGLALTGGHAGIRAHLDIAAAAGCWELGRGALAWRHLDSSVEQAGAEITTRAGASATVQALMVASADSDRPRFAEALARARRCDPSSFGLAQFHEALRASADAFEGMARMDTGHAGADDVIEPIGRLEAIGHSAPNMATGVQVLAQFVYAYRKAVVAGSLDDAQQIYGEIEHRLDLHVPAWSKRVDTYRQLALTFAGSYEEARALWSRSPTIPHGSDGEAVAQLALIRRECRAGSTERAKQALARFQPGEGFVARASHALATTDVAEATSGSDGLSAATALYELAEERHHGRFAGEAAVAIARLGGSSPARPGWVASGSSAAQWWEWAAAIVAADSPALRELAARLGKQGLRFESAMALEQAGETDTAFRAFRDIGATPARNRTSARLRQLRQPVPRRTRAALAEDSLTDAEREICRLVASGVSNAEVAAQLTVSVRTVETHLTNIYRKAGQRGRVALANWWRSRTTAPSD